MKVFGSPQRYYQGPGILQRSGELTRTLGARAALISDRQVIEMISPQLHDALAQQNATIYNVGFEGELTRRAVNQLLVEAKKHAPEFIIAAGGGKGIDAGKAVAHDLGIPYITLPTAASTDSPTSKNYVLYDDNHRMAGVFHIDRNPDSVIVDTEILARAPAHLLCCGIGDAIAKYFEARQCARVSGRNMFGHQPTLSALAFAKLCYDTLRENAEEALAVAGSGLPNDAFERVVEATILMAGIGFESGGLSVTHALTRGLPRLPGLETVPHGHLISYGLMVQLKLERGQEETHFALYNWLPKIGLPRNLGDLTKKVATPAQWDQAAKEILAAPHMANFERKVTAEELIEVMKNTAPKPVSV